MTGTAYRVENLGQEKQDDGVAPPMISGAWDKYGPMVRKTFRPLKPRFLIVPRNDPARGAFGWKLINGMGVKDGLKGFGRMPMIKLKELSERLARLEGYDGLECIARESEVLGCLGPPRCL
jgi:hypothetical protein